MKFSVNSYLNKLILRYRFAFIERKMGSICTEPLFMRFQPLFMHLRHQLFLKSHAPGVPLLLQFEIQQH
jgi:hypothetical protein